MPTKPTHEEMMQVVLEAMGWPEADTDDHGGWFNPVTGIRYFDRDFRESITAHFAGPREWLKDQGLDMRVLATMVTISDLSSSAGIVVNFCDCHSDPVKRICHALIEAEFAAVGKIEEG